MSAERTYRQAEEGEQILEIPFASLLPETRLRLAQACRHDEAIFRWSPWRLGTPRRWLAIGALFVLLLAPLIPSLGHIDGGSLAGSGWRRALLVVAAPGVFFSVLMALRAFLLGRGMTMDAGFYLFPREMLEAHRGKLRVVPASLLRFRHRGAGADLLVPGGTKLSLPDAVALENEQRRLRDALDLAASARDTVTVRRLDPLLDERPRLAEAPAASLAGNPGLSLRATARWLLAASFLLPLPLAALAAHGLRCWSDSVGIARAYRQSADESLLRYVHLGGPMADMADERRYMLACSQGIRALFDFLDTSLHSRRRGEAEDFLFDRVREGGYEHDLLRYRNLTPRHRAEIDELLFKRAVEQCETPLFDRPPEALERFISVASGPRAEEARTVHIPRYYLRRGRMRQSLQDLQTAREKAQTPEIRDEVHQALSAHYRGIKDNVASTRLHPELKRIVLLLLDHLIEHPDLRLEIPCSRKPDLLVLVRSDVVLVSPRGMFVEQAIVRELKANSRYMEDLLQACTTVPAPHLRITYDNHEVPGKRDSARANRTELDFTFYFPGQIPQSAKLSFSTQFHPDRESPDFIENVRKEYLRSFRDALRGEAPSGSP